MVHALNLRKPNPGTGTLSSRHERLQDIFDTATKTEFSELLVRLFNRAITEINSGRLLISAAPLELVNEKRALSALLLPGDQCLPTSEKYRSVDPPQNTVNLIRRYFAAVPTELTLADSLRAKHVLDDALRFTNVPKTQNSNVLPISTRVPRFYDAYERIGRLALSGEISPSRAAELITDSIWAQ